MRLLGFRIQNFRSIVDTGWSDFSPDGITVLVGQNESGKTSVLEALVATFSRAHIRSDDRRIDEPLPRISIRMETSAKELLPHLTNYYPEQVAVLAKFAGERIAFDTVFTWSPGDTKDAYAVSFFVDNAELSEHLEKVLPEPTSSSSPADEVARATTAAELAVENDETLTDPPATIGASDFAALDHFELAEVLFEIAPTFVLFQASSGLLPNEVDIDVAKADVNGEGADAARNFLAAANLNLSDLIKADLRTRRSILERACDRLSADFSKFWRQTIGKNRTIKIECDYETRGIETGKAGAPYLVFWITDGPTRLYPKQRSQGVRWFVSFYLQLRASERSSDKLVFLLDEPGANLHPRAQGDVLTLLNKLSDRITIVYTSHSPHMIEYDKIYRVRAVQRKDDLEDIRCRA